MYCTLAACHSMIECTCTCIHVYSFQQKNDTTKTDNEEWRTTRKMSSSITGE